MILNNNARASESLHWYQRDGASAYTVVGRNGKTRATNLRDARVLNLVPSVTTIIRSAAAPGLEAWKSEQLLMAALTLPRSLTETETQWLERVRSDAREQSRKAAEAGTIVHASLEKHFSGEIPEHFAHCKTVDFAITEHFGRCDWKAEASFACPQGYGGKVDLHGPGIVIDFKTKEFLPAEIKAFDEHHMQLAAYRHGLGMPQARCANVFVSVSHPVQVKVIEHTEEELQRGWKMFQSLLAFWKAKANFDPGWHA